MRGWLLLGALALGAGCSGSETVCSSACSKLHQCGLYQITITTITKYAYSDDCSAVQCDATTACISRCVEAAQCSELGVVQLGGKFHSCLIACNSFFRTPDGGG
jgi:hypothetical protein